MRKITNDPYRDEVGLYDPQAWKVVARLDAWLVSSLLQKSIRRGETAQAVAAGLRLHQLRGAAIWSRLMLVAVEDIGVASLPTLAHIATIVRLARKHAIGDNVLGAVATVCENFSRAPKDRSADYLISAAVYHPVFENERCLVGKASIDQRLTMATDISYPLVTRAIAAWFLSGWNHAGESRVGEGNLPGLIQAFADAGVPQELIFSVRYFCERLRHPFILTLPVLWMEASGRNARGLPRQMDVACPNSPVIKGVPAYVLDKHTFYGKAAITQFSTENKRVAAVLGRWVPDFRAADAAAMGAFYVDAIPVRPQFLWHGSSEIERLGREADFAKIVFPIEGIDELVGTILENLDHLNELRATRFLRRKSTGGCCDA